MSTILIIDDDPDLCTLVSVILEKDGYQVEAAYNGKEGLELAACTQPDLILLDVMMPEGDGWEVCETLRRTSDAPIIFLSARGSEGDVVRGLRLGGDDYIAKPFRRHELSARVEAVLRRASAEKEEEESIYQIGDLTINKTRWEVHRGKELIHLTPTEFNLLLLLAQRVGRPVSHQEILTTVWGPKHQDNLNLLKVYIRQLRQKIELDPNKPDYLLTKRGIGYLLAAQS